MVSVTKQPRRWTAIVGRWDFKDGHATYLGPESGSPVPYGVALSDARVGEGVIRASISLLEGADAGRVLLGYRAQNSRYVTVGLGGYGEAYIISEYVPDVGWSRMEGAGNHLNLETERQYEMEVYLEGQRVRLLVDGIRVLDHIMSEPLPGDQLGLFAWGSAQVTFTDIQVEGKRPKAFVVMEFKEPYSHLYDEVIRPVAEEQELDAYRVSEVYGPGIILQDIIQGIAQARVVIAEITPPNPNVFYELGYSHALKKPVILLAERGKQLPFDISGYRVIFYDNTIHGKKDVEDNLRRHLTAILRD